MAKPSKKIKSVARLLCLFGIFAAIFLWSCNDDRNADIKAPDDGQKSEDADLVSQETTEVPDNLPEMDFGGYGFRIYVRDEMQYGEDFIAEEENGEPINDAVYARNKKIEERFGIGIKTILFDSGDTLAYGVQNSVRAGSDDFDIIAMHGAGAFLFAANNLSLDWFENMPYIDFDAPWWPDDITKNLSAFGRLYCMTGDISHLGLSCTGALLFNKYLFESLGIEYPYNDVIGGSWTLDKFMSIVRQGSGDLNGDGIISPESDRYGFEISSEWAYPINVLYCGGDRVITIGDDGVPELTVYTPRTIDIFGKFAEIVNGGATYIGNGVSGPSVNMFEDGRALFYSSSLKAVISLRAMEQEIGVLPVPKYNESTPKYYANVDAGQNVIAIPATSTDNERTSIIVEALCAEGHRTVMPALYELSLKTKFARDDESAEMMDYIKDGRVYDYGYFNSSVSGWMAYTGRTLLVENDFNFASFYEKHADVVKKNIEGLNK